MRFNFRARGVQRSLVKVWQRSTAYERTLMQYLLAPPYRSLKRK